MDMTLERNALTTDDFVVIYTPLSPRNTTYIHGKEMKDGLYYKRMTLLERRGLLLFSCHVHGQRLNAS